MNEMFDKVKKNLIWKSVFRRDYRDTVRDRAAAIFGNVFLHIHPVKVRESAVKLRYTWGMGGITFFAFIILTITGIVLMFYYHPTVSHAYEDMKDFEFQVPYGVISRNLHRWAAHFMVIVVMIHMFRVFMTGSYKAPRQFNWGIGVILLVLTFLLSFTGYLLPWDQLGFWAITVGTNMGAATPLLGYQGPFSEFLHITPYNDVRFALLGGATVGGNALLRSYIWHCVAIPLVSIILMAVHFWRVRKDGGISRPQNN